MYRTRYESMLSMKRQPSHDARAKCHLSPTTCLIECRGTLSSSVQHGAPLTTVMLHNYMADSLKVSHSNPEQQGHFQKGNDYLESAWFTHGSSSFRTGSSSSSSDEPDSPLESAQKKKRRVISEGGRTTRERKCWLHQRENFSRDSAI